MPGTTTNALGRRRVNSHFNKYLSGLGIDIGCGRDPLPKSDLCSVDEYDVEIDRSHDAVLVPGISDNVYDFVYSSHCLEHLNDPWAALINWIRILKPEGHLFVCVPDLFLYEKEYWPSHYNGGHLYSFAMFTTKQQVGRTNHISVYHEILPFLRQNSMEIKEFQLECNGYDFSLGPEIDQSGEALTQIMFCARKIQE